MRTVLYLILKLDDIFIVDTDMLHFFMGGQSVGHGARVELCQVAGEPCVWCNGAVCHNNGTNRCEVYDVQVHGKGKVPGTDVGIPLEASGG